MFRNILNYTPDAGQINDLPSLTVPDETMSIRELVQRYSRGLPIKGIDKEAIFQPDIDGIPFEVLDISERHELMQEAQAKIKEFQDKQKEYNDKKLKEQQEKLIQDEVEKRLKAKEENEPLV